MRELQGFLTDQQVADLLNISLSTVRVRRHRRQLAFVKIGDRVLIPQSEVDRILAKRSRRVEFPALYETRCANG